MKAVLGALVFMAMAAGAQAAEFETAMRAYVTETVMGWAQNPVLLDAIRARNLATAGLSAEQVKAMDETWRAEVGTAATPTIDPIVKNAASDFLRDQVAKSEGRLTEVFAMDAIGLNAAASDVTSDFWQGDEDKFTQTFPFGAGAIHISEVELDESTQIYQAQVSLVIVDPATQQPIGAITLGLNADLF